MLQLHVNLRFPEENNALSLLHVDKEFTKPFSAKHAA